MPIPDTIPFLGSATWGDALFVIFSGVMIGSALLVVLVSNLIRAGISMIVCFAALAGLYCLLGAPVVGAVQVLIYIGAISVLALFALMLTQPKTGPSRFVFHTQGGPAAFAAILLAIMTGLAVTSTDWKASTQAQGVTLETLAHVLFSDYMLHFEVIGVLILAAMIGSVYLARREETEQ